MAKQCDEIDYRLIGEEMQAVVVTLDPDEQVIAEAGTMLYMTDGIDMQTSMANGKGTGFLGSLMKAAGRMLTGESFFITSYTNTGRARSDVAFAAPYPGKIVPIDLQKHGGTLICQKDSFLCAARGTEVAISFQKKLGTGLFGGEGFILQKLSGDGLAFVHAGGSVFPMDLVAGQKLRIDTGCIVAFEATVTYDIQMVRGFKNALFGGEGLFLATLQGPGRAYLQTLPFSRLADRIVSASKFGGKSRDEGSLLGGLLMGDSDS
ncbi:MAG: TIGR00266 family protein [Planctomycetes bacterium]|nr:TIGR00266 family protein [Planctomycetota bacterium]